MCVSVIIIIKEKETINLKESVRGAWDEIEGGGVEEVM